MAQGRKGSARVFADSRRSLLQAALQQVRSKVLAATSAEVITSSRLVGTVDTVATGPWLCPSSVTVSVSGDVAVAERVHI